MGTWVFWSRKVALPMPKRVCGSSWWFLVPRFGGGGAMWRLPCCEGCDVPLEMGRLWNKIRPRQVPTNCLRYSLLAIVDLDIQANQRILQMYVVFLLFCRHSKRFWWTSRWPNNTQRLWVVREFLRPIAGVHPGWSIMIYFVPSWNLSFFLSGSAKQLCLCLCKSP